MSITPNLILENEAVILRGLQQSDFEFFLPFSINEPELWKYSLVQANGKENLENYISIALTAKANLTDFPFIVYDKINQEYAGSTRFYDINFSFKTVQLGYTWYGKKFQGTGLNKNCKYLLLEFAFEKMNVERVGFRANNSNKRSIAAMKSIGCIEEGILRNFSTDAAGNRIDAIVLSILKNEWFASVKENLKNKIKN